MHHQGYSLFELLLVIALSSILFMLVIINWRDLQLRRELTDSTLELVAFFNRVKLNANVYNNNLAMYVVKKNNLNWQLVVMDNDQDDHGQPLLYFTPEIKQVEIVNSSDEPLVIFHGRRSMAQPITVKLQNELGRTHIIVSKRGRIRYCSLNINLAGLPKC